MQNPIQSFTSPEIFPKQHQRVDIWFSFHPKLLASLVGCLSGQTPVSSGFALWTYFLSAFLFYLIILQKWLEFKESSTLLKHI